VDGVEQIEDVAKLTRRRRKHVVVIPEMWAIGHRRGARGPHLTTNSAQKTGMNDLARRCSKSTVCERNTIRTPTATVDTEGDVYRS